MTLKIIQKDICVASQSFLIRVISVQIQVTLTSKDNILRKGDNDDMTMMMMTTTTTITTTTTTTTTATTTMAEAQELDF